MSVISLKEKWNKDGRLKLLAAVAVNVLFMLVLLCCFKARFETNDDVLLSKFVDGQMAEKSAYIPFINIIMGFMLKLLYTVGSDSLPWYSIAQYALMLAAFCAVTWVLLKKFRLLPAATMTAVVLMTVGMNSYLYPNFSKVSAVAVAGGLCLMLYAMSEAKPKSSVLIVGMVLTVLGYLWRIEEFYGVAAIMAAVGLVAVLNILGNRELSLKERMAGLWHYARPFVLLMLIVLLCFGFDRYMWTRGDYAFFTSYNDARSQLIDFGQLPDYQQMQDAYDSLDMDEDAVYLLSNWSFYDTDKFSLENIKTLINARNSIAENLSIGECVGKLLDEAIPGLAKTLAFAAMALMLLLWLACGSHGWREWLGLCCAFGVFAVIYMIMIYENRYLANRVDMGFFLALALTMSFLMDSRKLEKEKLLCSFVLVLVMFIGLYGNKNICKLSHQYDVEDKSSQKAAIEQLLEDDQHLYLCKVWSIDHELYEPLETAPAGFADKIVLLGGWSVYHPSIEHVLSQYGIVNPYPDMIDNDSVLLIDNDVERTVRYLQKYYDANATAEKLEELSQQTGLNIYRIVTRA